MIDKQEQTGVLTLAHGRHDAIHIELDIVIGDVEIVVDYVGEFHCGGCDQSVVVHAVDGTTLIIAADIRAERADVTWTARPAKGE